MTTRVLMIVPSIEPFGPWFQLQQVLPELPQLGIEVHLVALSPVAQDNQIRQQVSSFHADVAAARFSSPARGIDLACAEIQPDIVHDWCVGTAATRRLRRFGRRGCWVSTSTPRPSRPLAAFWQRFRLGPQAVIDYPRGRRHDTIAKRSSLRRRVDHRHVVPRSVRIRPVDRHATRQRLWLQRAIPAEAQLITCVAPLVASSQVKDALWALDLLACIRDDVYLLVAGHGPHHRTLMRYLETMPITARVVFAGIPDDLCDIVGASDVYWHLPTRDDTPDPMLWAMACGIPVIGVRGPATDSILLHQQTGLGVESGRRDQFARWTKFVFEQVERVHIMVDQARQLIAHSYAPSSAAVRLSTIYHNLASAARSNQQSPSRD